jgi:hypothetical protein
MRKNSLRLFYLLGIWVGLMAGLGGQTIQTLAGGAPRPGRTYDASQVQLESPVVGDGAGNFYVGGPHAVYQITSAGKLSLYAGTGVYLQNGGKGPATETPLGRVQTLAMDGSGNLYIADEDASVVREVVAATGQMEVVAGQPDKVGSTGDGGPAVQALLEDPVSVAVDGSGDIYIGDAVDCTVRKVSAADGTITTLVKGCSSTTSGLQRPEQLGVNGQGDLYILDGYAVWRRDASSGQLTVAAGIPLGGSPTCVPAQSTCLANQYYLPGSPGSLAVNAAGDVFIGARTEVDEVKADTGLLTKLASMSEAGVWADAAGDVYVSSGTQLQRIDGSTEAVSVVAGSLTPYLGDATLPLDLQLRGAVARDDLGDYFVNTGDAVIGITAAGQAHLIAGGGTAVPSGSPISISSLDLSGAQAIAVDSQGNLYVSVNSSNGSILGHVYKLDTTSGEASNLAGSFGPGDVNQDGDTAVKEELDRIGGLAVDAAGDVYISDGRNNVIWKVTPADGIIHRLAGSGLSGPPSGDGGPATQAILRTVGGVGVDAAGNVYLGTQYTIRKVDHTSGILTTIAGNGNFGTTGDGGPATAAALQSTRYLAVNAGGDVFVSGENSVRRVRASDGVIVTVAGGGDQWDGQFAGPALDAGLAEITGLTLDGSGNLYLISDPGVLREVKLQSALTLSPTVLNFTAQNIGSTSAGQTVTLKNSGGTDLHINGISLSGVNAGDFAQTNTCGSTLSAGAQCDVTVAFTPSASGARAANLEIGDDAAVGTAELALMGTGAVANAQLSATALDFGQETAGVTSSAQTVTLTNGGTAALSITSIGVSGNFAETNTCGSSLAAGAQCSIQVTFSPVSSVNYTGQLTIQFAGGSSTVALTGAGVEFHLAPPSLGSSQTVAAGGRASYQLPFQMQGELSGKLATSCTVAPANSTIGCSTLPANGTMVSWQAGGPSTLEVDVTTQARSLLPPFGAPLDWSWPVAGLILFLSGGLLVRRRRWLPAMGLASALVLAGCGGGGGGSSNPPPPPAATGTPAGTYTLTVSVTVGPVTHSQPLTLVVQ